MWNHTVQCDILWNHSVQIQCEDFKTMVQYARCSNLWMFWCPRLMFNVSRVETHKELWLWALMQSDAWSKQSIRHSAKFWSCFSYTDALHKTHQIFKVPTKKEIKEQNTKRLSKIMTMIVICAVNLFNIRKCLLS